MWPKEGHVSSTNLKLVIYVKQGEGLGDRLFPYCRV